jgi:hypothetical protein
LWSKNSNCPALEAVGPSVPVQRSGLSDAIPGGFQPQETAIEPSVAVPRLKWLAAVIGAGLTYAAISNTCVMATALSKLPYNRGATSDAKTVLAQFDTSPSGDSTTACER